MTEMQNETQEHRALRELVEALTQNTQLATLNTSNPTVDPKPVVVMTDPTIVSAMREAGAALGIKIER